MFFKHVGHKRRLLRTEAETHQEALQIKKTELLARENDIQKVEEELVKQTKILLNESNLCIDEKEYELYFQRLRFSNQILQD